MQAAPKAIMKPSTFSRQPARFQQVAIAVLFFVFCAALIAQTPKVNPNLPTLFLAGDSTVNNGTKGLQGWGTPIAEYFDHSKINVVNRARGGRSSRTFFTEGLWDKLLAEMKRGDFVIIQFGHNDGGPLTGEKARASL